MNSLILYSFIRCPYAMRARIALAFADITYELREVNLRDKPPELLQTSPKGTVPVLILEDGTVIDESLDIMLWALPKSSTEEMKVIINDCDTEFKFNIDHYKYPDRFPTDKNSPEYYKCEADKFLTSLELRLKDNKYLFADEISIADIGIFPFVRQFSKVEPQWFASSPYTKLQGWLSNITASKQFDVAMKKHPVWQA